MDELERGAGIAPPTSWFRALTPLRAKIKDRRSWHGQLPLHKPHVQSMYGALHVQFRAAQLGKLVITRIFTIQRGALYKRQLQPNTPYSSLPLDWDPQVDHPKRECVASGDSGTAL